MKLPPKQLEPTAIESYSQLPVDATAAPGELARRKENMASPCSLMSNLQLLPSIDNTIRNSFAKGVLEVWQCSPGGMKETTQRQMWR